MLEEFAKLVPSSLADVSGAVFYSGRSAFAAPSKLYVLGLNPGGSPVAQADETVGRSVQNALARTEDDWCEYRDESWQGRPPGTCRMQPRVLHLYRRLGLCPHNVPASNVIFVRSSRRATLDRAFRPLAQECWKLHQAVIEQLRVRVVLCFGQDAGSVVRERLRAHEQVDKFVERNRRCWESTAYRNAEGLSVVVATHPSIADWTARETDPTPLVEQALRSSTAASVTT